MNARISTALAAAAIGLAALTPPATGYAAIVGYSGTCYGEDRTVAITTAGHTPVEVAVLDAPSLASLDALMWAGCSYASNAAVDAAVADGLVLIVHDNNTSSGPRMPGNPALSITQTGGAFIDFPLGSPVLNGPGGAINNASLDGGSSSYHGYIPVPSLPVGVSVLATTDNATQATTVTYTRGAGRVVYSTIPLGCYLTGGGCADSGQYPTVSTGMQAYIANLVAWAVPDFVSCAAEGFTGSKLTLCRQVCEIDQTPTRLTSLIKLYMTAYRSEPPCSR